MGFDLYGAGGYFRWTGIGWSNVLELALEHGWEPTGTGPPTRTLKSDWDGNYYSNSGQRFYARDAKNVATALEKAVQKQEKSKAKRKKRQKPGMDWLLSPDGLESLDYFIFYCRAGSFRLG
jgi:hypothetical protein